MPTYKLFINGERKDSYNNKKISSLTIDSINYDIEPVFVSLGKYPQTYVSDTTLINALNGLTTANANGYYEYNNEEYAKISASPFSSSLTFADGTIVVEGTTYWFKVEPIKWRVLSDDNNEYMLLSEYLIDAKQYYNSSSSRTINGQTVYANNYEYSDIRTWLNNDFYNVAFTSEEKATIVTTEVDNSLASTGNTTNPYVCNDTEDKVFLLSTSEAMNTSYGFISSTSLTSTREAKITDYAVARGAYYDTSTDYLRNGYWWLRSPSNIVSYNECHVYHRGNVGTNGVTGVFVSARPALVVISN